MLITDPVLNRRKIALEDIGLFSIHIISRHQLFTYMDNHKCSTFSDVDTELSGTASRKQWINEHPISHN
ncbi:hypothetical protein CEXT_155901 [Caerostris extrusa]|uniref:Ycf15 n=1 Tax=Caerostris extrusa TaxID=172846 RepID=A0AAV4QCP4_CAEEX|nr:hypothetical protein CEXT_155901 [Caerostris extrusa]